DAVHDRPVVQARIGELPGAVIAGRREAKDADIPVEIAGIPTKHERRKGCIPRARLVSPVLKLKGPKVLKPSGPVNCGIPMPTSTSITTMLGMTATAYVPPRIFHGVT